MLHICKRGDNRYLRCKSVLTFSGACNYRRKEGKTCLQTNVNVEWMKNTRGENETLAQTLVKCSQSEMAVRRCSVNYGAGGSHSLIGF